MKLIGIYFIYLNHTSPDTVQTLFYLSVCEIHFKTKYIDLNVELWEPNLSKAEEAVGIPLKMCSE